MREDDRVVLGVGLVAPLPDPAVVVGEGAVKPSGRQGEGSMRMSPPASSGRHGPLGHSQMWMQLLRCKIGISAAV